MKDIRQAENFKDLWDNCISEEDRQSIAFQTDLIRKMQNARKEKHLSREDLAKSVGIKQPTLARIETFKSSPKVETIIKLLCSLGYKLEIVPIGNVQSKKLG
jgi:DNA-binding XRE family transcriptional regulator